MSQIAATPEQIIPAMAIHHLHPVAIAIFVFALPVVASGTATTQISFADIDPADAQKKVLETQALALKRLDFELFAKSKVQQLNRNHRFSRPRMEVTKRSDGKYRARYHQIDDSSMSVKVRRSQSRSIPYVGIVSYNNQIIRPTGKHCRHLRFPGAIFPDTRFENIVAD